MNDLNGTILGKFLRDSLGDPDAILDYSDTGLGITPFFIAAAEKETIVISRLIVHFASSTPTALKSGDYGGSTAGALTNGISVQHVDKDDNLLNDLTDGMTVKTNAGWARYNFNAEPLDYSQGNAQFTTRWTFTEHGRPIVLRNLAKFQLVLNDDMSTQNITAQTFYVGGYTLTQG